MADFSLPHAPRTLLRWPLPPVAAGVGLAALLAPLVCLLTWAIVPESVAAPLAASVGAFLLGAGAMTRGLHRDYPHRRLGACNGVTLVRAALVAVLAGAALAPSGLLAGSRDFAWAVTGIALAAFALDGLDGWAARRTRLISRFGAAFDMEVDVAFAFVLALLVWQTGEVGLWVLVLGLMNPAFVLLKRVWPAMRAPLPEARWRKTVCVVQIGALVALLSPVVAAPAAGLVAAAVLAMLVVSFARDIVWLARRAG